MGRSTYALPTQNEQLDLFRALPGEMAPRDAQDLMANPFFSLAKSRRTTPIDFRSGEVTVRVEGTLEHGIAKSETTLSCRACPTGERRAVGQRCVARYCAAQRDECSNRKCPVVRHR